MSNHFTGLSLGPPHGDQRLDLCDLYAFQSPSDPAKTVLILNANPTADALHPDAIYRLNIDNDRDCLTDIAFSYVFSKPENGKQTVDVYMAKGEESRSAEAVGKEIFSMLESLSAPPLISRNPAIIRSSLAAAAMLSFSITTASKISMTSEVAETLLRCSVVEKRPGRESIPTKKPTFSQQ